MSAMPKLISCGFRLGRIKEFGTRDDIFIYLWHASSLHSTKQIRNVCRYIELVEENEILYFKAFRNYYTDLVFCNTLMYI